MNKIVSMPSETKLTEKSPKNNFFGKDLMGKSFPFLDVKSVLNLLCVNKVVRMDMKAFLEDFRRPYASLIASIPASHEAFLGIIDTLEKSVRDLGYRSDKVTLRLLPNPPNLTPRQHQSLTKILYFSQNPANRQPLVADYVHFFCLSPVLVDPLATPREKEFATAALMNLSRELQQLLLDPQPDLLTKEWAAEALRHLSADPANLRPLVAAGVHISLTELLAGEQVISEATEYAVEALCNISADPANRRALLAAGVDFQFVELLNNGTASPRARVYAKRGFDNCARLPN